MQRSPRALERRVAADVLVTTPSDPDIHALSGGAAAVWAELAAPRTVPELVRRLASMHTVERAVIADQVEACVGELVALGLVEEALDA